MAIDVSRAETIKAALTERVMSRFGETVVSVNVDFEEDSEGADIAVVKIIFVGRSDRLDPKRMASLSADLRRTLNELDEDRLPIVRFISKNEYDHRRRVS